MNNFQRKIGPKLGEKNNIILMTLVTLLFVYKVRFGFQLFKIKPFHLGKSSGILFLILYLLYNFYNYIN